MSDNTVQLYVPCKDSKSGDSISVRCEVKKVQYNCVCSSNQYNGVRISSQVVVLHAVKVDFQKVQDEEAIVCDSFYREIDERLYRCCL